MLEIVKIVQRTENVMSKENAFVMKIGKVQIVVFRNVNLTVANRANVLMQINVLVIKDLQDHFVKKEFIYYLIIA